MHVLDLGTGLGHVARLAGELVGPGGTVLGIDQSKEALMLARERTLSTGATHVTFMERDVLSWSAPHGYDVIIGRLLLFHVPDPVVVVRHHLANLRPGGTFVAIDFDLGSARTEPTVALAADALRWVEEAFRAGGAWPRVGSRLGTILDEAGLAGVTTLGIQAYLPPRDPSGPRLLAGVVRSLAPTMVKHGIATDEEIGVGSIEQRLGDGMRQANAVLLPPAVVGAWGSAPDTQ